MPRYGYLPAIGLGLQALTQGWRDILRANKEDEQFQATQALRQEQFELEKQKLGAAIKQQEAESALLPGKLTQQTQALEKGNLDIEKLGMEVKASKEAQEAKKRPVDLKKALDVPWLMPETIQSFLEDAKQFGVDENGIGAKEDVDKAIASIFDPKNQKGQGYLLKNYNYHSSSRKKLEEQLHDPDKIIDISKQKELISKIEEHKQYENVLLNTIGGLKEYGKQRDAIESLENLKREWPGTWEKMSPATRMSIEKLASTGKTDDVNDAFKKIVEQEIKPNKVIEAKSKEGKLALDLYGKPLVELTPKELDAVMKTKKEEDTSEWKTFKTMGEEKGWNREKILSEWEKREIRKSVGKKEEKGLTPKSIDILFAKYNIGRVKAKTDPFKNILATAFASQGITIDPTQEWPQMNRKEFEDYVTTGALPAPKSKELDEEMAKSILKEAGGNKDKARKIAKDRGYKF